MITEPSMFRIECGFLLADRAEAFSLKKVVTRSFLAENIFYTAIPQEGLAWSGKTGWC